MAHQTPRPSGVSDGIEDLVDLVRGLLAHTAFARICQNGFRGPHSKPIAFTSMAAG